jgi:glycosyltransferase involved in cell wall biosynthesis
MKVLFLTHALPRSADAAAASLELRLAVALRGEGVEVVIVAPGGPGHGREEIDGVAIERFQVPRRELALAGTNDGSGEGWAPAWRPRLATLRFLGAEFTGAVRARRELEPDIVHAHWWFPGGLVGIWISALGNVPLVTSLHRADLSAAQAGSFARPLFRHVVRHSATLTADSPGLARKARSVVASVEPVIAPMPASTELFVPGGERAADRLLTVARLESSSGIEQVLQALAIMRTTVSLDVIGAGGDGKELQTLARSLGIGDRVRWHGQPDERALVPLFQQATAFVLPSLNDWLPLTAVHAMLCRTPVVAFDFGGIADLIQHGRTGILVPPSDTVALGRALDALLARSDQGGNLGEAARMYALSTFAPESVARRYAGIYRQALASAPA